MTQTVLPCDFCKGSRWLADQEAMGRCVCVTPENVRDLAARVMLQDSDIDAMGRKIATLTASLEAPEHDFGAADRETVAEAADILRRYFQSLGLDAHPIVLADPNLDALRELLL